MYNYRDAYRELDEFIALRFLDLKNKYNGQITSYSIKSGNEAFNKGWEIGFKRCLAEIERVLAKEEL